MAPSREIAMQLHEYFALLASDLPSMLAIGGLELKDQRKVLLVKRPKVIFATLGRLLEMLAKEYISLERLKVLALDEADKFTVKGKARAW